jgi:hypothetical protein
VITPWSTPCDSSACLQVRTVDDRVELRDSEHPDVVLSVTREVWEAFVAAIRNPPGGETREEWGVADVPPYPGEVRPVHHEGLARAALAKGLKAWRRTITTHVGPWRPVDTEETKP